MASQTIRILCMSTNGILDDGITAWLIATFGAMDLEGLEISTIAFEGLGGEIAPRVEAAGIEIIVLPHRQRNPKAYRKAFKDLLDNRRFDILHVCCNSALAAFELCEAKKRVVRMRIAHSRNTMCSHRVASFFVNPIFQSAVTDRLACGEDAGKWLFGERPFTVVPNGKDLTAYAFSRVDRLNYRDILGYGSDDVVIGHVGRFNEQKNHKKLLEVFASLCERSPEYKLALVGDGVLLDTIKAQAKSLGILDRVNFLGRRDDVPTLLSSFDCMVFPSLYEGFPNVVIEWQLNGLPVVMSDAITHESVITPFVSQVPLNAPADSWAYAVEVGLRGRERTADSRSGLEAAKLGGYDINENAAMLRQLYLQGIAN